MNDEPPSGIRKWTPKGMRDASEEIDRFGNRMFYLGKKQGEIKATKDILALVETKGIDKLDSRISWKALRFALKHRLKELEK
jgi:hypothetical protein